MAPASPSPPASPTASARIGPASTLRSEGQLVGKLGSLPVVVFWDGDRPWAVEDRCPHMGFPLHRGTVQDGMLTCHWHHARFDLASGCTFDLWADDAAAFDVDIDADDTVVVTTRDLGEDVDTLERRLLEGMEEQISLVIAKAVHALLARGVPPRRIAELALRFSAANRAEGWGPGMTVVQCVLNLVSHLPEDDVGRALTQGLAFLSRDTGGHPPHFPVAPLSSGATGDQMARWYRRFVENRSAQAAERVAVTAGRLDADLASTFMFAAATDHVFLDEGHVVDYLNKACEAVDAIGGDAAQVLLPTVVRPTATATRHEEVSEWREPIDLVPIIERTSDALDDHVSGSSPGLDEAELGAGAARLLDDDPHRAAAVLVEAAREGATAEQLARVVALAAALRLVRFHTQNDVGDWETVHHTFTTANAVHQAIARRPTPELLRAVVHGAMRVHLDRFLNIPAARTPPGRPHRLDELERCWSSLGGVDAAGEIVAGHLAGGGGSDEVVTELCRALFREDAGFHWFQAVDAGAAQVASWPDVPEARATVLVGLARWLAAHTPTVRRTDQVVSIARRLLRGDAVHEGPDEATVDQPGGS